MQHIAKDGQCSMLMMFHALRSTSLQHYQFPPNKGGVPLRLHGSNLRAIAMQETGGVFLDEVFFVGGPM
jgi:hypothetical protein